METKKKAEHLGFWQDFYLVIRTIVIPGVFLLGSIYFLRNILRMIIP